MKQDEIPRRLRYPLAEAAVLLGMGIDTLRERVAEGAIASVRDGKRIFIMNEELLRYAASDVALPKAS